MNKTEMNTMLVKMTAHDNGALGSLIFTQNWLISVAVAKTSDHGTTTTGPKHPCRQECTTANRTQAENVLWQR